MDQSELEFRPQNDDRFGIQLHAQREQRLSSFSLPRFAFPCRAYFIAKAKTCGSIWFVKTAGRDKKFKAVACHDKEVARRIAKSKKTSTLMKLFWRGLEVRVFQEEHAPALVNSAHIMFHFPSCKTITSPSILRVS